MKLEGGTEIAEDGPFARVRRRAGYGPYRPDPAVDQPAGRLCRAGRTRNEGKKAGRGCDGALEEAGAFAIVLEMVPEEVAARITGALTLPTIGIGAGRDVMVKCSFFTICFIISSPRFAPFCEALCQHR